jgi:4-amino-4-deoxy-L-arabinose transferase-like glycosyltransferase
MGRVFRRSVPLLPAVVVAAALLAIIASDPAPGVTYSQSPYTDEGYNLLSARNLVLLGTWTHGDWNLYIVNGPFSAAAAGMFRLFGVGLIPARLMVVVLSTASVALLALMVASRFGTAPGTVAAVALGGNALLLYYGRLAYLEPMVLFFLLAGTAALLARSRDAWPWPGLAAGLLYGLAVATKASALFAVVGVLVAVTVAGSWRDRRTVVSVSAAAAGMAVVGVSWLMMIALPNWSALLADLRIWAHQTPPRDAGELVTRIWEYLFGSDRAVPYLSTLLVAAAAGGVVARRRWGSLSRDQRVLVAAAIGWFAAGMALLLIVDYRPNRYVLPLVPALAILAALGGREVVRRLPRAAHWRAVAVAILAAGLALPGISAYASWAGNSTYVFRDAQSTVEGHVKPGEGIEGVMAPTFALRAPVPIFVSRPYDAIDAGNLWATHHVRWVIVDRSQIPAWVVDLPSVWARAQVVACVEWGGRDRCLVKFR